MSPVSNQMLSFFLSSLMFIVCGFHGHIHTNVFSSFHRMWITKYQLFLKFLRSEKFFTIYQMYFDLLNLPCRRVWVIVMQSSSMFRSTRFCISFFFYIYILKSLEKLSRNPDLKSWPEILTPNPDSKCWLKILTWNPDLKDRYPQILHRGSKVMFLNQVKKIFASQMQILLLKIMFRSLATQGNMSGNNVSATVFPSLGRP